MAFIGSAELVVVLFFLLLIYFFVYRARIRNIKKNRVPSMISAILLSLFLSPPAGILYTMGILPALVCFSVTAIFYIIITLSIGPNAGSPTIIICAIVSAILASINLKKGIKDGSTGKVQ